MIYSRSEFLLIPLYILDFIYKRNIYILLWNNYGQNVDTYFNYIN
jgi:hypothetical protein